MSVRRALQQRRRDRGGAGAVRSASRRSAAAKATVAFTIKDARITESSGLARDTAAGLYWTVNDSGASGVGVRAAAQRQGPGHPELSRSAGGRRGGRIPRRPALSRRHRRQRRAARFRHRSTTSTIPGANGLTVDYRAYDFRYPDGSHDAETLLVNGDGTAVHRDQGRQGRDLRRAARSRAATASTSSSGSADAPAVVTDGTFLPGGKRIALLTYDSVGSIDADTYKTVATADDPEAAAGRVDDRQPGREVAAGGQRGQEVQGLRDADPGAARRRPRRPPRRQVEPADSRRRVPTDAGAECRHATPEPSSPSAEPAPAPLAGVVGPRPRPTSSPATGQALWSRQWLAESEAAR